MFRRILDIIRPPAFKGYTNTSLDRKVLSEYYRSRTIANRTYLCHAPFNNMYFNSLGDVAHCWLTFDDPEQYSADRSIHDIWFGEKFTKLREQIKEYNLDYKCKTCKNNLQNGNFVNALSKAYDNDYPLGDYPSMMEFELSNVCNLECTMCTGLLSSSIRRNRENLPPLNSPYGEEFPEKLREFIPHLREARFNGGEPFLIKLYFRIWDLMLHINPDIKIVVATNGSVLNARIKDYLQRGNFHINLSIDSLTQSIYEDIRVNGNFERLMENFMYYRDYCKANNRNLCIMINPMRQNWFEMPDFVNFCNKHNVPLWFNTIHKPYDQALWTLSGNELREIYEKLSKAEIKSNSNAESSTYRYNLNTYRNLVEVQIKTWMLEAYDRESSAPKSISQDVDSGTHFFMKLDEYLTDQYSNRKEELTRQIKDKIEVIEKASRHKLTEEQYFALMNQNPIHIVAENLITQDTEHLIKRMDEYLSTIDQE